LTPRPLQTAKVTHKCHYISHQLCIQWEVWVNQLIKKHLWPWRLKITNLIRHRTFVGNQVQQRHAFMHARVHARTHTHTHTHRCYQIDEGLEIWYITKIAAGMGRERGVTCLSSAIYCNLTVGSLYKLVVLPSAYRSSLCKCYKYTSLVYLLFKYEGCISCQQHSILTHLEKRNICTIWFDSASL
jgi:hypothetical protein